MRSLLITILFCTLSLKGISQEPSKQELYPCGAPTGVSDFLEKYQRNPWMFAQPESGDTLWVAVQIHLLAKDSGAGRIPWDRYLAAFCRLNQDFAESGIQFYMKEPWDLLNNTGWHTHSTIPQGIDMMLTNNVEGALNAYFVSDPAGNCGYNLPYGGVAIAHGCAGPDDHTWAHEIGHALNLPHPFIGWEGKTYNYNNPTPQVLTYDYTYFHDTLDTQVPAPLDTALVEFVSGANCAVAADRICDTKADYLSYRWNCNPATQMSSVKQKDPNGVDFYSDGTLFMSYADDACQNRFSAEQISIMRATLATEKADWVIPAMLQQPVTELPTQIEPVLGQNQPVTGARLVWKSVPNATHYVVQASRIPSFGYKELDIVTTDTFAVCGSLTANKTYYWRVKPFNYWHACQPFTASETFFTNPSSEASEPDADGWRCYPSVISDESVLTLKTPSFWTGTEIQVSIFDMAGKQLFSAEIPCQEEIRLEIPGLKSWPGGTCQLIAVSGKGVKRQTIVKH